MELETLGNPGVTSRVSALARMDASDDVGDVGDSHSRERRDHGPFGRGHSSQDADGASVDPIAASDLERIKPGWRRQYLMVIDEASMLGRTLYEIDQELRILEDRPARPPPHQHRGQARIRRRSGRDVPLC